jgi:hypothetical protein
MILAYSKLIELPTFAERFDYLSLNGVVGESTFGGSRYLNQLFYNSKEWKEVRDIVIMRDEGCDLGCLDRPITGTIYIHHMNPIRKEDILTRSRKVLDPENLICVSFNTHQAIHYGDRSILIPDLVERYPNDTCPWK